MCTETTSPGRGTSPAYRDRLSPIWPSGSWDSGRPRRGGSEAIYLLLPRYPRRVTKRLIEVDDDKLEAVRALLGTRTLKATVDDAFNEVLALAQRRRALLADHGVDTDALADPAARRDAWG
jgi:Arc/MetJ family transcription regulator